MDHKNDSKNINNIDLLDKFNKRNSVAFGEVYSIFYDDLLHYAVSLYYDTVIDPQDAVHDTFVKLWQARNTQFDQLIDLKAYVFITLKNDFNYFLKRNTTVDKYKKYKQQNEDLFEYNIVESELFGYFNNILHLVPKESAEILRLFFEGWSTDEIALMLNKSKQTIYNKKHEAINKLKMKLPKNKLLLLTTILN